VLWVFFLPLAATALHMLFASKIMARMLKSFMLYDWGWCCSASAARCWRLRSSISASTALPQDVLLGSFTRKLQPYKKGVF
jgi:hypothetical protein